MNTRSSIHRVVVIASSCAAARAANAACAPDVTTCTAIDLNREAIMLVGEDALDYAGSVSGAGDVDGDGNDDVIVGACGNDAGGSVAGAAYVVLGPLAGRLDLGDADAKLVGEAPGSAAGRAVSGAGDVDGDGLDDVLIGAYYGSTFLTGFGAAYVMSGPVTGDVDLGAADARIVDESRNDGAGWDVSGAGDVDHDGHDDLLIGAPYHGEGGRRYAAGAAYIVLGPVSGRLDLLRRPDAKLVGQAIGDNAGSGVSGLGDVDGDGNDDILIGAPMNDAGGKNAGAAYLVMGPITGRVDLARADAKLIGENAGDAAGWDLSAAGDVDGDGHADALVGAYGNDQGGREAGAAYLVLGPVSGTLDLARSDAKLVGERMRAVAEAGYTVSGAGDVDGDGHDDLLVGAPATWEPPGAGAAYLVLGPVTGGVDLGTVGFKFTGALGDYAGDFVSGAGDVDNDGLDDFLVGATSHREGGSHPGAAYLIYGADLF